MGIKLTKCLICDEEVYHIYYKGEMKVVNRLNGIFSKWELHTCDIDKIIKNLKKNDE